MPKFKNKTEEVKTLTGWVKAAEEHVDRKLSMRWKRTLNDYRSRFKAAVAPDEHHVTVQVVQAICRLIIPSIYFRDPSIRLHARRPGTQELLRFTEELINYYIKELNLKPEVKRVILDTILFGIGYAKIGYEVDIEQNLEPITDELEGSPIYDGEGNLLLTDDKGYVYVDKGGMAIPIMDNKGQRIPDGDRYPTHLERIRREAPFAIRWSPFDVLRDPDSLRADLSDAMWVAFRSVLNLEEVQNHPYYKNTKDIEASRESNLMRHLRGKDRDSPQNMEELDKVVIYEMFIKQWDDNLKSYRMHWKIFAEGHEKFLVDEPSPYQIDGFPIAVLSFVDDPESAEPISLIEMVRPQIDVINVARSQYTNHRERFNQKYLFNRSAGITDMDARKVAKGRMGAFIGVKMSPEHRLDNAFAPLIVPPMDPSVYGDGDLAWDDIRKVLGIPEHYLGGTDVARQATQATYIEQSLGVRINEMQDIVGDFLIDICRKWKQILQQYATFEMAFNIAPHGQETWLQFKVSEAIPDDIDFQADMLQSTFQSREKEREDLVNFLNIVVALPYINTMPIVERIARNFGWPDPQNLFIQEQPQVDPATAGQMPQEGGQSLAEQAVDTNQFNRTANQTAGPQTGGSPL